MHLAHCLRLTVREPASKACPWSATDDTSYRWHGSTSAEIFVVASNRSLRLKANVPFSRCDLARALAGSACAARRAGVPPGAPGGPAEVRRWQAVPCPRPSLFRIVPDSHPESLHWDSRSSAHLRKPSVAGHQCNLPKAIEVLYLTIPVEEAVRRKGGARGLLELVATVYNELAQEARYVSLDATKPPEEIANEAKRQLRRILQSISDKGA